MQILRVLPKSWISYFLGKLAHIPLPSFLSQPLLSWFVNRYKVDLSEIENPIESFNSIGDFFTRELKPDARPLGMAPVSPADSYLRNIGQVQNGLITQVKDQNYSISQLLGCEDKAKKFLNGTYANFYLSPKDYHRVHAPVSGTITQLTHIPGALWPVNDWSLYAIKNLFCVNERIVIYIDSQFGEVALIMVGATNVGKISVTFDKLQTNAAPWLSKQVFHKVYDQDHAFELHKVKVGDLLGTFHLGSTVIMLFEPNNFDWNLSPRAVKYGQSLLQVL